MSELDEERIAELLGIAAGAGRLGARAEELPLVRRGLDAIITGRRPTGLSRRPRGGPRGSACRAGFDPHPLLIVALRERLADG